MMRRLFSILLVFIIGTSYSIDSQNIVTQSLQLANGYLHTDMEAAEKQAKSALALAQKIGFKDGEAEANWILGRINFNEGNIDQSGILFQKAYNMFDENGNRKMYATALKDYADFLRVKGQTKEALKTLDNVRSIAKKIQNSSLEAECDMIQGMIDFSLGNFPSATDNTLLALKKAEEIGNNQAIINAYLQLGNINSLQGNLDGSNKYFTKALELNKQIGNKLGEADAACNIGANYLKDGDFDKATIFIQRSVDICRKLDYNSTLALNLMNLGYLKVGQKKYTEGEQLLKESEVLYTSMKNKNGLAEVENILGYLYSSKREFDKALAYYNKSIEISEISHSASLLQSSYEGMAYIYEQRGDFKTAYYYEKLNDKWASKFFSLDNSKLVTQKQMNYEFEKIQKEQAKEQALKDEIIVQKTTRVRILVSSILVILILLGGVVVATYIAYFFANKNKKLLAEKNELLKREKEDKDRIIREVLPREIEKKLLENHLFAKEKLAHVMFVDFVDFSKKEDLFDPYDLMEHMDVIFRTLGGIAKKHQLETMKTMTDGYLYISGLEGINTQSSFAKIIDASIEIHQELAAVREKRQEQRKPYFDLRIGIHSGPILGGVVGVRTLNSDIWGNTVQIAAALEKKAKASETYISNSCLLYLDTQKHSLSSVGGKIQINGEEVELFQLLRPIEKTNLNVSSNLDDDFFKNFEA